MIRRRIAAQVVFSFLMTTAICFAQKEKAPDVRDAKLGKTRNVHACGTLFLAGQPTTDDISKIKQTGVTRVISLRQDGEIDWNEQQSIEQAGMKFIQVPFRSPDSLTDDVFGKIRTLLRDAKTPTLLHCGSANRVGAVWLTYRVLDQGVALDKALEEAKTVGLRNPDYENKAVDYVRRKSKADEKEQSVRPGINNNFLDPNLDVTQWLGRFEIESREVYAARDQVVQACGVQPGWRVADVGAGTGFYSRLFATAVGENGWVYAVDIAARFLEHVNQRAREDQVTNITAVLGAENSINLPPASIDLAFVCDTYHHFEYPMQTLASIHRSLRDHGTLIVIDFERIPGESREWVVNHVRSGKQEFRGEIEAAGFEFVNQVEIGGFRENYFLSFRKK